MTYTINHFDTFTKFFTLYNKEMLEKHSDIMSIFESKNYEEYGWFQGCFMTDKFGGIAVIIKNINGKWFYNNKEVTYDWILFESLEEIYNDVKRTYNERNMEEICNLINSEY